MPEPAASTVPANAVELLPKLSAQDLALANKVINTLPADPRRRKEHLTHAARQARPKLRAYLFTIRDLLDHAYELHPGSPPCIAAPSLDAWSGSREEFRDRQKHALLAERADQLVEPKVREFIASFDERLNRRPLWRYLVADPRELAQRLQRHLAKRSGPLPVQPYLELARQNRRFFPGGPSTLDVWRYLRYTWSLKQERVPGRVMNFLIRDAAGPGRPVIGLLAVTNGPIHLAARDQWIGWHPESIHQQLTQAIVAGSGSAYLTKLRRRLQDGLTNGLHDIYTKDLRKNGRLAIPNLEKIVAIYAGKALQAPRIEKMPPKKATKLPYYRAKRSRVVLAILRSKAALRHLPHDPGQALQFLDTKEGHDMLVTALGEIRKPAVGNYLIDFSTCGAIPPYNHLLGGKLVAMLGTHPAIRRAFATKYGKEPSLIASAMAGRYIRRRPKPLIAGTTSLFASHSSQYDRIRIPVRGGELRYTEVGLTDGQTSMHVSREALHAYRVLLRAGRRHVPSNAFGGGAGAKMRLAHAALRQLGFTDALLSTNMPRLVYVVELAEGARTHLLWATGTPRFRTPTQPIADFWWTRWAQPRLERNGLAAVRRTKLTSILPPQ